MTDGITLHHGDCLQVLPSIESGSVDLVLADLPYGMTDADWDVELDNQYIINEIKRISKSNAAVLMFAIQPFATRLICQWNNAFRYDIIWKKDPFGFMNSKRMPMRSHEHILVFYRKLPTYNPQMCDGGKPYKVKPSKMLSALLGQNRPNKTTTMRINNGQRYPVSIIEFKIDRPRLHPTAKPVALLEWLIRSYSNENDLVLDPTMGSGSTGVACVRTGRKFIGIEKDAKFFDVAKSRIKENEFMGAAV